MARSSVPKVKPNSTPTSREYYSSPYCHISFQANLYFRGHTDFAESTEEIAPLTEEEKKKRLEELRERVKAKREGQAAVDKEEQKRNEVFLLLTHQLASNMLTNVHIENPPKGN